MIACILIPFFPTAVERRADPALAEIPLILHVSETVYAASPEAFEAGVRAGMPLRKARALLPTARTLPVASSKYRQKFAELLRILGNFTHLVEPEAGTVATKRRAKTVRQQEIFSGDSFSIACYLDLETLKPAESVDLARSVIRAVERELGLCPAVGLAAGKFPARIAAASIKPGAEKYVPPGEEAAFLAPLPVTLLPLDSEMIRRLRILGIQTLEQFARLSTGSAAAQFGKTGYLLRQLAEGRDSRPVVPYKPKALERVTRSLDNPITDRTILEAILRSAAEELALHLQTLGSMGRELELVLHLEGGGTHERKFTLRQPVSSAGHIEEIIAHLLAQISLQNGVTGVEVGLGGLVQSAGRQLDLFVHQTGQEKLLRAALKDVVARYGAECFFWIVGVDLRARLPERSFHLKRVE